MIAVVSVTPATLETTLVAHDATPERDGEDSEGNKSQGKSSSSSGERAAKKKVGKEVALGARDDSVAHARAPHQPTRCVRSVDHEPFARSLFALFCRRLI